MNDTPGNGNKAPVVQVALGPADKYVLLKLDGNTVEILPSPALSVDEVFGMLWSAVASFVHNALGGNRKIIVPR